MPLGSHGFQKSVLADAEKKSVLIDLVAGSNHLQLYVEYSLIRSIVVVSAQKGYPCHRIPD